MQIGKKHALIAVYVVSIILFASAIIYIYELNTPQKIHVYTTDFALNGEQSHMIFKFESEGGAFTTGNKIHVSALLGTNYSSTAGKYLLLHFPNTLDPEQYEKIKNEKTWSPTINGNLYQFSFPERHFLQWSDNSIITEYDLVWTQEGQQDAIFIIDDSLPQFDENGNLDYGNHVVLNNIITIQPSDVRLQIKTTNLIIGLTLVTIILTIVAFYSNYDSSRSRN